MIRIENINILSASMGEENPLADINNIEYIHAGYEVTERVSEEERTWLGKGMISTILPYTMQDNYNRNRKPRNFKAVILENEYLKATFLPELGGRLWSLFDKEKNKELLYVNPVFQPANLAIRNAWFSGGVEFNVGIKGHNMLTCEPLFTRIAKTENGEEVLQMYEFERIRKIVYGINAYLPAGSRVLYIQDVVENLNDRETFMYWWSNIAVPESSKVRVVAPCNQSFISYYNEGHYILDKTPIPIQEGIDITYPTNSKRSLDFFYQIPKESTERWVAAMQEDGIALAQMSSIEMKGRKLFVWGQGNGGKNWGNFLSDGSGTYVEIQAGLTYNQLEHIPMPANTTWSWTEGYTGIQCDKDAVYSEDWECAVGEVSKQIHKNLEADDIHEKLHEIVPTEFVSYTPVLSGSGFGALEAASDNRRISNFYEFGPASYDEKQADWIDLLEKGYLSYRKPEQAPISYVVGDTWEKRLMASLQLQGGQHWYTYYQLGVVQYASGKVDDATQSFLRSVEMEENAWSYRNLAMLSKSSGDASTAADYMMKAVGIYNDNINLLLDCANCLLKAERYAELVSFYGTLPEYAKERGRMRLYLASAYLELQLYDQAAEIINPTFSMDDIREGEFSISHIWDELYCAIVKRNHPQLSDDEVKTRRLVEYPLPRAIDFRMHE